MSEIKTIQQELHAMRIFFNKVINIIKAFHITDPNILPYGLKPHTRSVSWIIEQVIVQQAKCNKTALGVDDVSFDLADTCLHDCVVSLKGVHYYVNIKVTDSGKAQTRNDIAAAVKLLDQYRANADYRLIYAVFPFSFDNTLITLEKNAVHTFSPQFLPVYVNPSNHKIQAYYHATPEIRTRDDFLNLLET